LSNQVEITEAGIIGIKWDEGASNGGTPVFEFRISYRLETDASFSILEESYTLH
jgi:hypothetical protein